MHWLSIRDIALIAVISAILALTSYILIMPFVLIVMALALEKKHIYPISIITAVAVFMLWGFDLYYLVNLFFLPLIVLTIHLSLLLISGNQEKNETSKLHRFYISLMAFLIVLITNFLNIIFSGLIYGTLEATLMQYALSNILSAVGNGLLVYIIGFYLQRRLQELLVDF